MLVTLDGISMLPRLEHAMNAESPMLLSWLPVANVTLLSMPQELNALFPMLVTSDEISMLLRLEHAMNARSPMLVTSSPMLTL